MHAILCSDNPVTRQLVGNALAPMDRVTACESGMELLAAVRAIASDLVILDLETHGLGGLLLISAVQELAPGLPIVAVSLDAGIDSRPVVQRGIPFFRLAAGDRDGSNAFCQHVRGSSLGCRSVSAA